MRYIILLIICLCANCLSAFGQQTLSNPLVLGPILVDQPTVEKMIAVCEQYKLNETPSNDEYRTFQHDDGTLIKFDMLSDSVGVKKPYVEIYTTESKKAIERTLLDAGYHKEKNVYIKGNKVALKFTTCHIIGGKEKRIIFTKERGKIKTYKD